MKLLNFFKQKAVSITHDVTVPVHRPECDINKTYIIAELFKVPRADRGERWLQEFYANVASASFTCDYPQTLTGPDGFTYFILKTPETDRPFASFCIRNMRSDFLLERGWGVVFNPSGDNCTDWVFTYGSLLNHHLTGNFITPPDERDLRNVELNGNTRHTKRAEQVVVAQPSETYLPAFARQALRSFLQNKGIKTPKILMLSSLEEERIVRKLAFNIAPENYSVRTRLNHLMQQVGWFLPNNYIPVPLSEKEELAKGFQPL
jgi:hypothetical protein